MHCALPSNITHPRPFGDLLTPPPQPLPVNPIHLHLNRGKQLLTGDVNGQGQWNRGVQEVKMMLDAMDLEIQGDVARVKEGLDEVRTSLVEMRTAETGGSVRGSRGQR